MKILASTLLILLLYRCVATGLRFNPPEPMISSDPQIVVYRVSQIRGKAGTWVRTRLEVNGKVVGKLPDQSFITFSQPAGDITLSAIALVEIDHTSEENKLTSPKKVAIYKKK